MDHDWLWDRLLRGRWDRRWRRRLGALGSGAAARRRGARARVLPALGVVLCVAGAFVAWAPLARAQATAGSDLLGALRWRPLGPAIAGGRVTSVAGVPGQPLIYYVGTAGGGVWKTTNGGASWTAIFAHEPVTSIGDIALAPTNPNLVWVGTGEANIRNDVIDGGGVYFSPDGGATWKFMGLPEAGQIGRVRVSPADPKIVFVAAVGNAWQPNPQRGVYRTTDGGLTWTRVLFVNDQTGAVDLCFEPGNPMVVYAAMWQIVRKPWGFWSGGMDGGIYRSTDGGTTWTKLQNGLPRGPIGRIGLATAPTAPRRLYALIESKQGVLYRSDDLGDHWRLISNNHNLDVRGFYFSRLAVAPDNADTVYFLSEELSESTDGGKTIHAIDRGVHPDHHAIWIDPDAPNRIIEGNDGGVYVSLDGGNDWRYLDNLPIEQFYQVGASDRPAPILCGGLQDNNAWCGPAQTQGEPITSSHWFTVAGGDGQYAVPAPSDPETVYADSQEAGIARVDLRTGMAESIRPYAWSGRERELKDLRYRFNWTSPIAVLPTDPNTVYLGGNALFESTDGGESWRAISPDLTRNDKSKQVLNGGPVFPETSPAENYDTILSFRLSPVDPRVIWVGTDDGLVQVTRDGGAHWTNVTGNIPRLPEWGRVQQIDASPFDPAAAYVAVDFDETGDRHPYVFKTDDYGQTWTNISAGLPPAEGARVIREDPNRKGLLVVGTDTGLFISLDDGSIWQPLRGNLPTVTVYDLTFIKGRHDLIVATHGLGLFALDDIRPLEEETPEVLASDFHLFSSPVAYRFVPDRLGSAERFGSAPFVFTAPNPPNGVVIDYYLRGGTRDPQAGVNITVTDASGRVVDQFPGTDRAGINRVVWNLAYAAPLPLNFVPRSEAGGGRLLVPPGAYTVAVTAGGATQSHRVEVRPDPRFPAHPEDFAAAARIGLQIRSEVSALDEMLNRLTDLHDELTESEKLMHSAEPGGGASTGFAPLVAAARSLDAKAVALKASAYDTVSQPGVAEDFLHGFSYLRGELVTTMQQMGDAYDEAPRPDLVRKATTLRQELDDNLSRFNALVRNDVADYNRLALRLHAATLFAGPPIRYAGR